MVIYGSDDVSLKQQSKNTTRQTKQSERAKESDDDPKACQELTTPTETKRQNESEKDLSSAWPRLDGRADDGHRFRSS